MDATPAIARAAVRELIEDLDHRYVETLELLDGPTAIQRIVEDVPESLGFDVAWIGEPVEQGSLELRHSVRTTTDAVNGLVVPPDIGLGGRVMTEARALWVRNYITAPQITHDFAAQADAEGLRAMIAVPIMHRGKILGVLYGANRYETDFGDRAVRLLDQIAGRAAAATVVAERAQHAAEVAAYEERRRLALELHDTVGAMLYTIGAGIRRLGAELADCVPALNVRQRITSLEEQAAEAAAALRGSLRVLNTPPEQVALGVALREDARAFQERTGVPARVITLTELPALDRSRINALSEVVREALLNVEKHAGARSVVVSVFRTGEGLTVTISDDGIGLPEDLRDGQGMGLVSAAERMARIGGKLSINDSDDGGVSVQAWLPQ